MVRRLAGLAALGLLVGICLGCSGEEATPPESSKSQAMANESSSVWTDEQKQAMQKAMSNRRSDSK